MPRRAPLRALLALPLLLSACSGTPGPVEVAVPPGPVPPACVRLAQQLPATLGSGLARREVSGDGQRTAAWGDPPVRLACGTAPPGPTGQQLQLGPDDASIVTFAIRDLDRATAFTTVGLAVPVTVTVPDSYDSTLLVPLAGLLHATDSG